MTTKLTTDQVDRILRTGYLRRLGNYLSSIQPMKIQCVKCNHVRSVTVGRLLYCIRRGSAPCPVCHKRQKLTNGIIDLRLQGRNIKRVSSYVGDLDPVKWKCVSCSHQWDTRVTKVINEHTGCPKCSYKDRNRSRRLTQANIEHRILHRPLKLVSLYEKLSAKATWQCTVCNHKWVASPEKVVNQYTGCPHCAPDGQYGQKVIHEGKRFDSKLEFDCYWMVREFFDEQMITRQVRYPHNARMTADFVVQQHKLWIEVSSFKARKYLDKIVGKRKAVETIGNTLMFASSPGDLRKQLEKFLNRQT